MPPVAAPTAPAAKLVVGYVALNATQMPAWVAKDEGIFDRNGLDVDLRYLPTNTSPTAAVLSGEVQVLVAAEQPIQADLSGADLVYVAAPTETIFYSVYTRPEIVDGAGLKGKKIGITGAGAATETAARMALRNLRLDPERDITLSSMGTAQNILAGLQNGAIDAGVLSTPTTLQAQSLGMRELVNVARLNDPFPSAWSAASRAYVAAHQDTFARYVKSIAQAVAAEVADPNQTQQILGKYIQITDPAIVRASYAEVVPYLRHNVRPDVQAVRTALDELAASVPQAASADPASFIDSSFADQLESSGLIRELYP